MGKLEKSYNEVVDLLGKKLENDPRLNDFVKASKDFDNLLEKGLIEKRGNQLKSLTELHLNPVNFNTKRDVTI